MVSDAGFSLLEIMIVVVLVVVLVTVVVPDLTQATKAANEATAISHLRSWSSAQELYHQRHGVYADTDQDLIDAGLITGSDRLGYSFSLNAVGGVGWWGTATPRIAGVTGDRHFYVGVDGVIRWAVGGPADSGSPPLNSTDSAVAIIPGE